MTTAAEAGTLYDGVVKGDRRALARSITLAESSRPDHRAIAQAVIERSLPQSCMVPRIGISGTPGVGKSTFIEALGLHLVALGLRPAVISIDPTSQVSGGSILGDKTRMPGLSASPNAYIRPSASGGVLGGVAEASDGVILLCEAAGYGPILLETVGTGQSETAVDQLTDLFVLLVAPGGGDDLQGIKRGVMELIDMLVVNKADGPRTTEAKATVAAYRAALSLMRPKHPDLPVEVTSCSALEKSGIAEVWARVDDRWQQMAANATLGDRRIAQRRRLVETRSRHELLERVAPRLADLTAAHDHEIVSGTRSPASVAAEIVTSAIAEIGLDD